VILTRSLKIAPPRCLASVGPEIVPDHAGAGQRLPLPRSSSDWPAATANPELLALLANEELHAPALLDFEVASALRGHALGGRPDQLRLDEAVEDFGGLAIERHT
jgi:hypothetical protein